MGGIWVQLLEGQGPALLLFLIYVNVSGMHPGPSQPLTISAPWVLIHVGWSIFLVPQWVTTSRFLVVNKKGELKPTTISSPLLFRVFLSFLFF